MSAFQEFQVRPSSEMLLTPDVLTPHMAALFRTLQAGDRISVKGTYGDVDISLALELLWPMPVRRMPASQVFPPLSLFTLARRSRRRTRRRSTSNRTTTMTMTMTMTMAILLLLLPSCSLALALLLLLLFSCSLALALVLLLLLSCSCSLALLPPAQQPLRTVRPALVHRIVEWSVAKFSEIRPTL